MIIQYLQNAGSSGAKRDAIFEYLKEVLPQNKTQEQQERMIGNILSEMKEIDWFIPKVGHGFWGRNSSIIVEIWLFITVKWDYNLKVVKSLV